MSKVTMPAPTAYAVMSGGRLYEVYTSIDTARRAADSIDGYRATIEHLITTTQAEAYAEARVRESQQWQPIETAPKTGRKVLLGFVNSHGNWRTMLGRWISKEEILNEWEDVDLFDEGWYEISVEADDAPNCWLTNPSHWLPLPPPPVE